MTGIFGSLFRATADETVTAGDADDHWYRGYGQRSTAGRVVTPDTAMQVAAVFSCVNLLARTVAMLPLTIRKREANGDSTDAPQNPLYGLLRTRPNDWQTSYDFRAMMMGHLCLRGNAYAEIKPGVRGAVDQLIPLHPDRVAVRRNSEGTLTYDITSPFSGQMRKLVADEIFHLRGLSSDGVLGISPIAQMREAVGLALATEEHGARLFSNGATPGGALLMPGKLSKQAKADLKSDWEELQGGLGNSHRVAVLTEGMKWEQIGLSNEDSQFLATRSFQIEEIARIFQVPLFMLGISEKATTWGCLPADTMVFTERGPVPIVEVNAGDRVWSYDGDGMVLSAVKARVMNGYKRIRKIETHGRTLRVTDNHVVFVRRLQKGKGGKSSYVSSWIRADQIKKGDYLGLPHGLPIDGNDVSPDGRKLTVEFMELCGLYLGDGSSDKGRIEISHEKGADYMAHYCASIRSEFGALPYLDQKKEIRTRFSSKAAIKALAPFFGTSATKRVPAWVFSLSRPLMLALLRGYVDSDGNIIHGRIGFTSCNSLLLEDIRHLCIAAGVPVGCVRVGIKAGQTTILGRVYDRLPKYVLNLSSVAHNAPIGSNSPKKAARLRGATKRSLTYDDDWTGLRGLKGREVSPLGWAAKGLRLQRVRSISPLSDLSVPVYDLEVADTASFVADGVLVHNSGLEQLLIGFVIYSLMPWLVAWEQAIARDLIIAPDVFFAKFNLNALLRGDSSQRAAFYKTMVGLHAMTPNEVREREDMNKIEGGDEFPPTPSTSPGAPPGGDAAPDDPTKGATEAAPEFTIKGMPGTPGKDGADGTDGTNGTDAPAIIEGRIDAAGHLNIEMSDGRTIDAGPVRLDRSQLAQVVDRVRVETEAAQTTRTDTLLEGMSARLDATLQTMTAPRKFIMDPVTGKPVGIEVVPPKV